MLINNNNLERLLLYKNALNKLQSLGFNKVFSDNLADAAGVASTQVRKDFSVLKLSGNKRGGYQINDLVEKLNIILGKKELNNVILIGAGNIGRALLNYRGFEKAGIKITAGFDIDPAKQSEKPLVLPLEDLEEYVHKNKIEIAVLAVPEGAAQQALDLLAAAGIRGVLNFSSLRLKGNDRTVINNVNLELELENVLYFVNALG
ncbi:MAG: redox-sensing transcriptional repressor Rex [Candidatus Margulisbacteria bacterium]|jgi:redox-sensing transcriptional repressor|nr:redox-sensing transcriptional repressor Rex [Candidatus Margulisiibacteriota bacterium]